VSVVFVLWTSTASTMLLRTLPSFIPGLRIPVRLLVVAARLFKSTLLRCVNRLLEHSSLDLSHLSTEPIGERLFFQPSRRKPQNCAPSICGSTGANFDKHG